MRPSRHLRFALAAASVLAAAGGCSAQEKLGGPGAVCEQATDCQEGLICVPQKNGPNACSSDVALVQFVEEAGAPDAARRPASDGSTADGSGALDGAGGQDAMLGPDSAADGADAAADSAAVVTTDAFDDTPTE